MSASTEDNEFLKKLIRSKSGLKCVRINDSHQSPFILKEPPWVPDNQVIKCGECNVKFTLTNRRHHCRRCGYIFCSNCCKTKTWLPRMCFMDPVRVCRPCSVICANELDFFDHGIRTLITGATVVVNSLTGRQDYHPTYLTHVKLSPSHKYLEFDRLEYNKINLESVTDYSHSCDVETGKIWIEMFYENKGVRLSTDTTSNCDELTLKWIRALEKAFSLISINPRPDNNSA